jgi:hypothetical protein
MSWQRAQKGAASTIATHQTIRLSLTQQTRQTLLWVTAKSVPIDLLVDTLCKLGVCAAVFANGLTPPKPFMLFYDNIVK